MILYSTLIAFYAIHMDYFYICVWGRGVNLHTYSLNLQQDMHVSEQEEILEMVFFLGRKKKETIYL